MDSQYAQRLAPYPQPPDHSTPPWTPTLAHAGHLHGHPAQSTGGAAFVQPHFPHFGGSPAGPFPGGLVGAPVNTHFGARVSQFSTFPELPGADAQGPSYHPEPEPHRRQQGQDRLLHGGMSPGRLQWFTHGSSSGAAQSEDEAALQRRLDTQWLTEFSQRTKSRSRSLPVQQREGVRSSAVLRRALSVTAQLVRRLEESCVALKRNLQTCGGWEDSYRTALHVKAELQDTAQSFGTLKAARRRARRLRARPEERSSDREAAIDRWRMKRIQQVEEKKKEKELKLAADSVLSEVRKKQVDVKRMQDVLRSLEKLRRLRKDAASRRGIVTEQQCDEDFTAKLEQLRCVLKKRTVVYCAEEKALMVMLEGEQEKERKREQERRGKKEQERQLQRKRTVDSILFGEEAPVDCGKLPFTQYYTQAQQSLHSLIQVRREWDLFMVGADHPEGSTVPRSWILPDLPSDTVWASAQRTADTDCNSFLLSPFSTRA